MVTPPNPRFVLVPSDPGQPESTDAAVRSAKQVKRPSLRMAASLKLPGPTLRVLDSLGDGLKLVEMPIEIANHLEQVTPGVRVVPIRQYHLPMVPRAASRTPRGSSKRPNQKLELIVLSKEKGTPISNAMVLAVTNFERGEGESGETDKNGRVQLPIGKSVVKLERLIVVPRSGFWGYARRDLLARHGDRIYLDSIDFNEIDSVRHFYGNVTESCGAGVTVGVVDSGIVSDHPDLILDGGRNVVQGEADHRIEDGESCHGTHVAGIIASKGSPPHGLPGVAPSVRLRIYRVFDESGNTTNFAVAKAIYLAVEDGCDLINLSLGGGEPDEVIRTEIENAHNQGSLVFVAAGNDFGQPVSFPASDPRSIAVSAFGRLGTFPKGSIAEEDQTDIYSSDCENFFAAFSNYGPEIEYIGPGVGVVSTVRGGYAVISGTSMACPAVTGRAAKILSANPELLALPRNNIRSTKIVDLLRISAQPLGFSDVKYEGRGLLK